MCNRQKSTAEVVSPNCLPYSIDYTIRGRSFSACLSDGAADDEIPRIRSWSDATIGGGDWILLASPRLPSSWQVNATAVFTQTIYVRWLYAFCC